MKSIKKAMFKGFIESVIKNKVFSYVRTGTTTLLSILYMLANAQNPKVATISKAQDKKMFEKIVKENILSMPKETKLPRMQFIGYSITTSLENNKQKEDIPPFFHDVYDNNKLAALKPDGELKMYCIFNMHKNQKDFDYYVAVENHRNINEDSYATLQLSKGKYIKVDFIKRNNRTVHVVMMYLRNEWMKSNGFKEREAPAFILYDNRFHSNYEKYGRKGDDYLGKPEATLYLPVERLKSPH